MARLSGSILIFALVTLLITGVQSYAQSLQLCGALNPLNAQGASGYFAMTLSPSLGQATYNLQLNLNGYVNPLSCDLTKGLKYHIHSFWNNKTATSSAGQVACGASNTGGHYDPAFACSASSQGNTDTTTYNVSGQPVVTASNCALLGRTTTSRPSYKYSCNSTIFQQQGHFSQCEVGDLSGKFGLLMPVDGTAPGGLVFSSSPSLITDTYPPILYDYLTKDVVTNNVLVADMWSSVVFHCNDPAVPSTLDRLLCLSLQTSTSSLAACSLEGASFAENTCASSSSSTNSVSQETFAAAVAAATIVSLVMGAACVLIGLLVSRNRKEGASTSKAFLLDNSNNGKPRGELSRPINNDSA